MWRNRRPLSRIAAFICGSSSSGVARVSGCRRPLAVGPEFTCPSGVSDPWRHPIESWEFLSSIDDMYALRVISNTDSSDRGDSCAASQVPLALLGH